MPIVPIEQFVEHLCPDCNKVLKPYSEKEGELAMEGFWICKSCGEKFQIPYKRISKYNMEKAYMEHEVRPRNII